MADASTLIKFASWLGSALGKSASLFAEFSTDRLGVALPDAFLQRNDITDALAIAKRSGESLKTISSELATVGQTNNTGDIAAKLVTYGTTFKDYIFSISSLIQTIDGAVNPASFPDAANRQAAEGLVSSLKKKLVDYIILTGVEFVSPQLLYALKLLGLIEWGYTPAQPGTDINSGYVKKELHFNRLKDLFDDPLDHFQNTIGWGTNAFDPSAFFGIFVELLEEEVDFDLGDDNGEPFLEYGIFKITRDSSTSPSSLRIDIDATFEKAETIRRTLNKFIGLNIETGVELNGGASAILSPPFSVELQPNQGEVEGRFKLYINRHEFARPFGIINTDILNIEAEDHHLGFELTANWDVVNQKASINPKLIAMLSGAKLELGNEDGDGFVSSLLANAKVAGNFDLGMEWSGKDGLKILASGGIEIYLPIHLDLGPVELEALYFYLQLKQGGNMALETSAEISAMLGPIQAVVERMGILTKIDFADNNDGNVGPLDLKLKFKPPNGVGLAVDAGVVKGGGYLFFDHDREEYAGALELVFSEWIALKAVGLVTTRLPDGSKGFSMVIIISVEFGSGLQLGFGFTLLGVGGILGINRTVNIDALSAGVRSGAIESVMFPQNVVANAPKIISDLRQFFPAANDQFLIGPMAKIGYGTPTLISLSLGVILEFPDVNITILGILKVALPTEEAAVIKLQVNFLGRIEPSNKLLWFHAFLFDSRILFITLEGGMGLLVNWGDDSSFVVSVGGFHPRFNPPPLPFEAIPRLAVNILNESAAKIRIEGYFAVTSNTVQFGARAELFFGFSAINVQGHLGFDALFQFNPFYFIFEFSLGLSVKVFGFGLFSIGVSGLLEGPAKWHIEGTAKWKITWFGPTIRIRINETWGEERKTELPPIEVFPLLKKEFAAITNWEAIVPKQSSLLVALRKLGDTESAPDSNDIDTRPLVLHPVGTLRISQRKIPLKLKLDKIGSQRPSDVNKLEVSANLGGNGEALTPTIVKEKFARGEFQELDKAKKLSSPAFEKYESGLRVNAPGDALQTSMAVKRVIRYETVIIDNLFRRKAIAFYKQLQLIFSTVFATLFAHFLNGNAITKSTLSFKQQKQLQPNKEVIRIKANGYAVAFNNNNKPVDQVAAQFESQAEAQDYLIKQSQQNAAAAMGMHVIPNTEVNQAA